MISSDKDALKKKELLLRSSTQIVNVITNKHKATLQLRNGPNLKHNSTKQPHSRDLSRDGGASCSGHVNPFIERDQSTKSLYKIRHTDGEIYTADDYSL